MVKALTIGLAVALVASIGLNIAVRRGPITRPPFEYFPDMARTVQVQRVRGESEFPRWHDAQSAAERHDSARLAAAWRATRRRRPGGIP